MPQVKNPPGAVDYGLLLLLAAIWGASFLLLKVAVGTIPPATLTAIRLLIAALVLIITARLAREKLTDFKSLWPTIAIAGFFGNAAPFFLISWGEERIDSALAAILMAIMPLTTIMLAHFFTNDEKLNRYKLAGVLLGLIGLVILIGPESLGKLGDQSIRQLAVAGAAVCYGINALVTKRLAGQPAWALSSAIIVASAIIMVPASFLFENPLQISPSMPAIWGTLSLALIQTALATLVMVTIIKRQGASFFSQTNFMIPVVGVILGAVFLGERIGFSALLALGLILTGIAITRYGGIWGARRD